MNCRTLVLALALAATLPSSATAATPAPAWSIDSFAHPTVLTSSQNGSCTSPIPRKLGHCDGYTVIATNTGSLPTDGSTITLSDTLPSGLTVQELSLTRSGSNTEDLSPHCNLGALRCEISNAISPDEELKFEIYFAVKANASGVLLNTVEVAGGGAESVSATSQNSVNALPPLFGVTDLAAGIRDVAGQPDTRAGSHPYEQATRIELANLFRVVPDDQLNGVHQTSVQDLRDVIVDLPVGFVGSALSSQQCTLAQLTAVGGCAPDTVVGHIFTEPPSSISLTTVESSIYNLVPENGAAAEFGYEDLLHATHVLYANVVPTAAGYVLRVTARETPQISLTSIITNFYGDPPTRAGDPGGIHVPTFTNPADCEDHPLITSIHIDSWQNPGSYSPDGNPDFSDPAWASATSESPPVTGCNQLQFHPSIEAKPETNRADSPTGLDVNLTVPQSEGTETLGTPPLKKAVVTLPVGMTVNPSSANGLSGCSLSDLGMSATGQPDAAPPRCPDSSKIGTVELETPALPGVLHGEIYVARQTENPFGTLLALYIVVNDPKTGVIVKIPAEVNADLETGRLTTTVDNNPQFPFSELRTHFFGGQRAALRTPATCGSFKVTSQLTPWSAPESGPPATPVGSFEITQSPSGAPCPASPAEEPHKPSFSAGTLTPSAGAFSPFALRLAREDGSQELKGLSVNLPPGLVGKLAGVAECSEAALGSTAVKTGVQEITSPSCPVSSEVGTVTVGAGAGLTPYYATGHIYLAGPYKGAPLSLAVITPAVAGPYDLGDILVRTALQVDPETARITAVSDPLPTILQGIPLDVRSINLSMSRNQFTLNPTNCEKMAVSGTATSVFGQAAALSNPFQVGGCKALGFRPKLEIHLKGPTGRGGNPALRATLTYPTKGAYANVAAASVALPHSEFLDNAHIRTVCTKVQLAARKCPPGSIYGHARAITPLLDKPLEGPVYLGTGYGHVLPDLIADLDGQIHVILNGTVDSIKGGIRNRFEVVPDAPVTKFTLTMQGAKKGLLQNSTNLCMSTNRVVAKFTAQNGKVLEAEPVLSNSCKKAKSKKKHHRAAG
jgi:uncharacterized repeat protein (TIGR01451 family)